MIDPREAAKKVANEYRDFLIKSNMFALAMGVVIGNAVSKVVGAIVEDCVMPVAGVFQAEGNWRKGLQLDVWRFHFKLGDLLGVVIDFFIIATIVFLITKLFIRKEPPPPTKPCAMCLEPIHVDARRCKFCTSEVQAAPEPPKA